MKKVSNDEFVPRREWCARLMKITAGVLITALSVIACATAIVSAFGQDWATVAFCALVGVPAGVLGVYMVKQGEERR